MSKKTFREVNPEAAEMWDYEKNDVTITPDTISGGSDYPAFFRCTTNPKHTFQKRVSKMTSNRDGHNIGCIYCGPNAKLAFSGETDLLTVVPMAKEMWDYSKNRELNPENLLPKSNKHAYFKCQNGHSVYRKIQDFYFSQRCPDCLKNNTLLIVNHPNIELFWRTELNIEYDMYSEIQTSTNKIYLKCPECKYEWKWLISHWHETPFCPCCGFDGQVGSREYNAERIKKYHIKTLIQHLPKIEKVWDYDKNKNVTPDSLQHMSNQTIWLICNKGHSYPENVCNISRKPHNLLICPICTNRSSKIRIGDNDLFTKCEEAKRMWDYEKNSSIDVSKLGVRSSVKAYFICERNHSFQKLISEFVKHPFCQKCKQMDTQNIAVARPDMLKFWDKVRMPFNPDEILPFSKETGYWKCKTCGYEWEQSFESRATARAGKCTSCDLKRIKVDKLFKDSFREHNPSASDYWITEMNNGMTPDNTAWRSGKEVYLKCPNNSEHVFSVKVITIPDIAPYGCKTCMEEERTIIKGVNDILTLCPKAVMMWDYDKNTSVDPMKLTTISGTKVFWKCNNSHSFSRSIKAFISNPTCPDCNKEERFTPIAAVPHMVKQWDFKYNKGIDINMTSAYSKDEASWKCKKCGYKWTAQIYSRYASKGLCPCCETRIVVEPGITDILSLVPDLKDWIDDIEDIDFTTVGISSDTKIHWKCPVCKIRWESFPSSRIQTIDGKLDIKDCPYCTKRRRSLSFAEEYPDLNERFLSELNGCELKDLNGSNQKDKFYWHCNLCGENFLSSLETMIKSRNSAFQGCSYCAGKITTRENSFASKHPEVMDEYSPENTIDPYTVTEKSQIYVKWICRNNKEHIWEAPFSARAIGQGGCNVCRGYNYGRMLYKERPDLEPFYDKEKNDRSFSSFSNMSNEPIIWKCSLGHNFELPIYSMSRHNEFFCQVCNETLLVKGVNDLLTTYPALAKEFSKNEPNKSEDLTKNSGISILWTCPVCNGEYDYKLKDREIGDDSCPYCSNRKILVGFNSLTDIKPELAKEWSLNNEKAATDYFATSTFRALWKCSTCNGEYGYNINDRDVGDDSCPYCRNTRVLAGYNTLDATNPELAKEWGLSNEYKITEFISTSSARVLWLCPTCNGEYSYKINEREVGDYSCPYCRNTRVLAGYNTLDATNPELAKEWGSSNEYKVTEFMSTSSARVLWICPTCNGEYSYKINEREVGDDSCPYCRNTRVLAGYNTLDATNPELAKEWGSSNEYKVTEFMSTSSTRVLWFCPTCKGEYIYKINEREVGDDSCPYCRNTRVLSGYNSFAVKYPDLLEEWDYINNYLLVDPDKILDTFNKPVWWRCKNDKSHKYMMSPKKKLYYQMRHMRSCTVCKGYRRKRQHFVQLQK